MIQWKVVTLLLLLDFNLDLSIIIASPFIKFLWVFLDSEQAKRCGLCLKPRWCVSGGIRCNDGLRSKAGGLVVLVNSPPSHVASLFFNKRNRSFQLNKRGLIHVAFCWIPDHECIISYEQADSEALFAAAHLPLRVIFYDFSHPVESPVCISY
ncbi:hypothetical protein TNCV_2900311 [Trichonephila clavipes]|nr:hypothetical protein TNCV_2900311 [Trichonephila clavipes]